MSVSKCSKVACKVSQHFLVERCEDLCVRPGWSMSTHFASQFGELRSGILQIWKKCQIPVDLKILLLFSDLQYSTFRCSESAYKLFRHFPAGQCVDQCVNTWTNHVMRHFASHFRALRSGILQIWKSFRFLMISRFWHFSQICNIPLLSAPNWHAKCLNIFWTGAARVRLGGGLGEWGGGGNGCGNYLLTEPRKDPSHLQFSNSEASCLAPCGNIWLTFSGLTSYFI